MRWELDPDLALIAPALPRLTDLLGAPDKGVAAKACWALSCVSSHFAHIVLEHGVLPQVVQLVCAASNDLVFEPALRLMESVTVLSDAQINF